ncbi:unnamed protein product [Schistosoma curassoni]|uniref:MFS domain-containing protein n=1 Tax=Schistosoma curassoni TaxID=6186 RepID=A0A183KQ43_9TREM|nr:unnamed protein product [Schistosoma curassoni]
MSYIAARVDNNISDSSAVWLSALGLGCQGLAMPIGGFMGRKFGPKSTMIATLILGRRFTDPELLDRVPNVFLEHEDGNEEEEEEEEEGLERARIQTSPSTDSKKKKLVNGDSKLNRNTVVEVNVKSGKLLRHIDYYLLFFMMLLNCFPISVLTSSLKIFGQTHISDDRFLSTITAVTSLFNCGGRVVWGAVVDRFSFKVILNFITYPYENSF